MGTYTYAPFTPTVALFTITYTDQKEEGSIVYVQLVFTSASGGTAIGVKNNGTVRIGAFTLK